jgi:Secretion system C-terminal sorting domain
MKHYFLQFILFFLFNGIISCKQGVNSGDQSTPQMDGLERALHQEFMMTRDPLLNIVPRERLNEARNVMTNLSAARITALTWQERGPNNVAGRTRAIMIDKRDASGNTVFGGSVGGGLFKTTNFTSSVPVWSPVNDFLPNLAITNIIQDNSNQNIMYATTGEGWFNVDAIRGGGVYKSTDGGTTWTLMPSTTSFEYIQDMLIDNNGNLYISQRNLTTTNRGVIRSTDGGSTWTQVLGAPVPGFATGRAADLELASNGDIYASLGIFGRSVVVKSSFAANGANTGALGTWQDITPVTSTVTQRTEIVLAPSDAQRVYLLMQDSATSQVLNVYRSNDGGANWITLPAPAALNNGSNSQTWFNLIGAVDPANPDVIVVGGLNLARSTDGGTIWTSITTSGSVHVDHHVLIYNGSSKLLNGNDGGIYYSENTNAATPTFANKNNGYNVTQYYACDLHPTTPNFFLAGAQDNGTQRFNSPGINSTTNASGGDGGFCHIDQTDGSLQITSFTANNYSRSLNSGSSFSSLGSSVNNNRGQFINPTDLDDNAKVLYCGDDAGRYYYITGLTGTPVGNIATVSSMLARELTAVKVDPSASNTIYVGASFGSLVPQVYKITSANSTNPTVVSAANIGTVANSAISSIDIDPANSNHLVVTLSNFGVNSVFESNDGGATFSSIEGNLPDMPVRWALFAPANAQLNGAAGGNGGILLGTELGVWTTSQIAGSSTQWIPNNGGLANVRTDMLRYRPSDNTVVAATHGRGLFTSVIPTVITGVSNNTNTRDFIKYISSQQGILNIVTGNLTTRSMSVQLFNSGGQQVYQGKHNYQNTTIDMSRLPAGNYILKVLGDKKEYFARPFIR